METKRYLAGIDAGTTGTTVMIVDLNGNVVGSAYREYLCEYPHPGWVEQDIHLVWRKICEASREVLSVTGIAAEEIASIGVSSQRGTFLCIDKNGKPLHDSIVWNDTRASAQATELKTAIGGDRYHALTGMPISGLWTAAKIKWLVVNKPEIVDKCFKVVNGQEYLLHCLGCETWYSDPSSLTLNGMMDIDSLDWSDEIIAATGLTRDLFPSMTTPAHQEGTVSNWAAGQTGFAPGTPVCRGGGDQQCAAVGAGIVREGMAEITIGTAAMMVAHIDSRRDDPEKKAYIGGHALPGKWDMEGGAFATGACLRWWRDVFGHAEVQAAQNLGADVYDLIMLEAAKAPAGCKGHMFFPFLNGQVTPIYDNNARGGSLGLTLAHDRPTMIRSVLEGTAYELRMVVESLEEVLGRPFDILRLTGGGAKSKLWVQIQADVYGRPVQTLKNSECTTLGAAILGGVGAGVFSDVESAVRLMVKTGTILEPNTSNHDLYTKLFSIFIDSCNALRSARIYDRLSALQSRL